MNRRNTVSVNLTDEETEVLDKIRGPMSRSSFMRGLFIGFINQLVERQKAQEASNENEIKEDIKE